LNGIKAGPVPKGDAAAVADADADAIGAVDKLNLLKFDEFDST
jgi:hypothetical protein